MVKLALVLALVFASAAACSAAKSCSGPADCSYNGHCEDDACTCFPQFQGADCDVFAFQPLDIAKGVGYKRIAESGERTSSWGGTVVYSNEDEVRDGV